jgi:hypothetical protein
MIGAAGLIIMCDQKEYYLQHMHIGWEHIW